METVTGNLLDMFDTGEFDIIVHGCNCRNNMGGGIAAQIAKRYPKVQEHDNNTIPGDWNKFGTSDFVWMTGWWSRMLPYIFSPKIIVNAYTQYDGGPNASLNAILSAFRNLSSQIEDGGMTNLRIGIPAIGCGIGGLVWEDVEVAIKESAPNLDITLVEFG